MYAYEEDDGGPGAYQRSVRERANASLHDLEDVLDGSPNASLNTSARAKEQLSSAVHPRHLRWYEGDRRPQKDKDAASYLQNVLRVPESVDSPERTEMSRTETAPTHRGPMPSPEEAAALLQQQSKYMQQLEAENRYMKDEFTTVRIKIRDLLDENQRLHAELKKSVMEEIMMDGDLLKAVGEGDRPVPEGTEPSMVQGNVKQVQIELEKLTALHNAKTERLESQLELTREEVQRYEQMVEDLRSQLRLHDAIPTREDGIPEAFMSETQRGYHNATINRLTKERNELLEHVANLKLKVVEMTQREDDAYQQMKKGIELVEQAQLEQTQAMIQKEQLAEELNNMKQRFDSHVSGLQQRINDERAVVRSENKVVVEELNTKIKELTEQMVSAQNEMEKALRDKVALINELETAKLQIRRYDKEVSLATDNFNAESTNAKIQKSQAVNEASRLRNELDNLRRDKDQEKIRLLTELDDVKRRLNKAERELVNSKEECIHLASNTQALERELHLAKLARDSVERGRSDDLKAMSKRTQAREDELSGVIAEMEEQHTHTTSEMDTMLSKQNKLIGKLKTECRKQAAQIESTMKKNRSESGKLKRHNEELKNRLQRSISRLRDLEDQVVQHSRVEEKMTERIKMMDDHSQHQGTQVLELLTKQTGLMSDRELLTREVLELLTKQTGLMRDRQLLAREVEFLRRNISKNNQDELNKFVSSNKLLVDEVLENIHGEDLEKKDYVTKPKTVSIEDL